jgi:glutathione S-transferase
LLPLDPKARAHSRLWSDHINRKILPLFYKYLQEQDTQKQITHAADFLAVTQTLVKAADPVGPFFLGKELSFVDVQFAPWILRLRRVLKPYRGWPDPEPGSRWEKWVSAIESNVNVKATTSDDGLYLDSYERYAGEFSRGYCIDMYIHINHQQKIGQTQVKSQRL